MCPCYDPRSSDSAREQTVYVNIDNPKDKKAIHDLSKDVAWLEAGLCAIITELENRGIANEVIAQASKSGLIGLMDFWKEHSEKDEVRLFAKLHEFSEHEQGILKKLLDK